VVLAAHAAVARNAAAKKQKILLREPQVVRFVISFSPDGLTAGYVTGSGIEL
jgi:hypothetical protein